MHSLFKIQSSILIIVFSSFIQFNIRGNSFELKWFNKDFKSFIKIDLKSNQVFRENVKTKKYDLIGNLLSNHPEITTLDCNFFTIKEFDLKKRTIISIVGTNLVYEFKQLKNNFKLIRLDKSTFKGFNFFAYQFIRKDTLFSIGGYGFWQFNNNLIFFDEKNKGWEIYKYKNETIKEIAYDVCGYDTEKDGIWTLNLIKPEKIVEGKNDQYLYFFNFKTKLWEYKGIVNKEPFIKFVGSTERAFWVINRFAFNSKEGCILVDPAKNKILINDLRNRRFGNGNEIFQLDDSLFIYNPKEINPFEKYQVLKLNKTDFLKNFIPIDEQFIRNTFFETKLMWLYSLIAFFLLSCIILKFYYKFKNENSIFNENEILFLNLLISSDSGLNTEDLNKYLDISKKNIDIQKNQRNLFIKNINTKFMIKYNGENLVERKSFENDRRFINYVINPKYSALIKSILK